MRSGACAQDFIESLPLAAPLLIAAPAMPAPNFGWWNTTYSGSANTVPASIAARVPNE